MITEEGKAFEQTIAQMQQDLQYLANKGKVSEKFLDKQNRILKTLIDYYNSSQQHLSFLQDQLTETQIRNSNYRNELTDRVIKFEAVCILHGIIDFPRFISQHKITLINWAKDLQYRDSFMLSDMMRERIKELPKEERQTLEKILFAQTDQRAQKALKGINKKRKETHGITAYRHKKTR